MIHLETNPLPSGFVPAQPLLPNETQNPVKTVNGHTIESLRASKTFQRSAGNDLDRLSMASKELRSLVGSDSVKQARAFARTIKK